MTITVLTIGAKVLFTTTDTKTGEVTYRPATVVKFQSSTHTCIEVPAPTDSHPKRTIKFTVKNADLKEL